MMKTVTHTRIVISDLFGGTVRFLQCFVCGKLSCRSLPLQFTTGALQGKKLLVTYS